MKRLDDLEECVFTGKEMIHHTDYKPNCMKCNGYKMMCEQKGVYKSKWEIKNKLQKKN